jgi:hypothetical protein
VEENGMLIFARVLRATATNSIRRASTGATGGQESSVIDHVPWRTVAIGAAGGAIGFFGKMLHDDNLATRTELKDNNLAIRAELQIVRKEAREDIQALEARVDKRFDGVDKRFDKIEDTLKEISGYLRPAPNK